LEHPFCQCHRPVCLPPFFAPSPARMTRRSRYNNRYQRQAHAAASVRFALRPPVPRTRFPLIVTILTAAANYCFFSATSPPSPTSFRFQIWLHFATSTCMIIIDNSLITFCAFFQNCLPVSLRLLKAHVMTTLPRRNVYYPLFHCSAPPNRTSIYHLSS